MKKVRLYNTLSRKIEEFIPIEKNRVKMYTCGPTVYNYAHIGNLRTYVFEDILKRVLLSAGYEVFHVMNITDIGHLTYDDWGEDKVEIAARREGKTVRDITEFYTNAFISDLKKLNIIEPDVWCKASEHIKEQIELIKKIEERGFTYITEDGVYFDTSKLPDYGKLARLDKEGLAEGIRVDIKGKKNKTDFALWKFSPKDKKRLMEWDSPWGKGFPGWHIECSAMSMKYLGDQFDIHCGGIDHIPVHHTNEIAQVECVTGKPWVKYWLHGEFLVLEHEKMAKSTGNFITLNTLEEKGFDPLEYRYFLLMAHYRTPLKFSFDALNAAKSGYSSLINMIRDWKKDKNNGEIYEITKNIEEEFFSYCYNDLDIPRAISIMWKKVIRNTELPDSQKIYLIKSFDKVLGLDLLAKAQTEDSLDEETMNLIKQRTEARKRKDYKTADAIREELRRRGIILQDTKDGVKWRRI